MAYPDDPVPPGYFYPQGSNVPPSYSAMLLRQKLAETFRNKQGFAKNPGEGIAAFGQSMADAMERKRLEDMLDRMSAGEAASAGDPDLKRPGAPSANSSTAVTTPGAGSTASYDPTDTGRNSIAMAMMSPFTGPSDEATPPKAFSVAETQADRDSAFNAPLVNSTRFNPVMTNRDTGNSVIAGQIPTGSFGSLRAYGGALPDVPLAQTQPSEPPAVADTNPRVPPLPETGEPYQVAALGGIPAGGQANPPISTDMMLAPPTIHEPNVRTPDMQMAQATQPAIPGRPVRPQQPQLAEPDEFPARYRPQLGPSPTPPEMVPRTKRELAAERYLANPGISPEFRKSLEDILKQEKEDRTFENTRRAEDYRSRLQSYNTRKTEIEKLMAGEREAAIREAVDREKLAQARRDRPATGIPDYGPPSAEVPDPNLGTPFSRQRTGIVDIGRPPAGVSEKEWVDKNIDGVTKAQQAAPKALAAMESSIKLIDYVKNHPGLKSGIGLTGIARRYLPETEAYNFDVANNQLQNKQFLVAYEILKGGGPISNIEGGKAASAQARLDPKQSEAAYKKGLEDLDESIRSDMEQVQRRMRMPVTAWRRGNDNTSFAPDQGETVVWKGKPQKYVGGDPFKDTSYEQVR